MKFYLVLLVCIQITVSKTTEIRGKFSLLDNGRIDYNDELSCNVTTEKLEVNRNLNLGKFFHVCL